MLHHLMLAQLMVTGEVQVAARVVEQKQDLVYLVPSALLVHLPVVRLTQQTYALLQV